MIKRRLIFGALIATSLLASCKDEIPVDEKIDSAKSIKEKIIKKKKSEKKISDEEAKQAIEDSKLQVDMFVFTKLLREHKGKNSTEIGCKLTKILKLEDGKLKFTFSPDCTIFGKKYDGSLTIEYKPVGLIGFKKTLTYDSFVKDGIKLSGKVTFEGVLKNNQGNLYATSSYDLATTLPDGTKYTKKGTHKIERVDRGGTLRWSDDVYETTGEWTSNGILGSRSIKITKPIVNKLNCLKGAVSGTMEISRGKEKSVIDFGTGDCERKTTIDGRELKI